MPLWNATDANSGSPIFTPSQVNLAPTRANANLMFGNTTAGILVTNAAIGVFGVSAGEQAAASGNTAAGAHAGWNLRIAGTGGRAGRVFYETLVAGGSITGDAEDTIFPDYRIVIDTQPSTSNEQTGNAVSFTVVASSVPSGATLVYQWQSDGGPGSQTWANVANTGVFTNSNTATLSISNNITLSGNTYRALVYVTGGTATVISANAQLLSY